MPADIEVHLRHTKFYKEWRHDNGGIFGNRYDYHRLTRMIESIRPFYNRNVYGKVYYFHDGEINIVNCKRGVSDGKSLIIFYENGVLQRITCNYVNLICVKKQGPYVISG